MIESLFLLSSFSLFIQSIQAMADEQVMLTQIAHLSVQNKEVDMMGETNYVGSSSSSSSKCSDSTTTCGSGSGHGDGVCVICMDKTPLQETALVKGCEHAYWWATYNKNPSCPQCKLPFLFLYVHRSLDGRIHDYMFEESVCLLLRATWFVPVPLVPQEENCDDLDDIYHYAEYEDEDDDDDLDDIYFNRSPSLRIGNRRWGDNGYVRAGRKEARPINRESHQVPEAGSSSGSKQKEVAKEATGRRAKRALKREAADKAAAEKHIKHLQRFGRK